MDMKPQTAELKSGVEVLVATPGRLLDHIEAKTAVLNQVEYVVLDEADRMLDIGFLPDLQRILSYLPKQRTTLAVLSHVLARDQTLGRQLSAKPGHHRGGATQCKPRLRWTQRFYSISDDDKRRALQHSVERKRGITQAFVFVNSKLGCARLARSLEREGLQHSSPARRQKPRRAVESAWTPSKKARWICWYAPMWLRVAWTSRTCRPCSISICPFNAEDYVHRIGRTGPRGCLWPGGQLCQRWKRRAAAGQY
jgi:superfamily II DNA/RNA helicase